MWAEVYQGTVIQVIPNALDVFLRRGNKQIPNLEDLPYKAFLEYGIYTFISAKRDPSIKVVHATYTVDDANRVVFETITAEKDPVGVMKRQKRVEANNYRNRKQNSGFELGKGDSLDITPLGLANLHVLSLAKSDKPRVIKTREGNFITKTKEEYDSLLTAIGTHLTNMNSEEQEIIQTVEGLDDLDGILGFDIKKKWQNKGN